MSVIVKVQAQWQGFQGAPGYTNWYGLSDGDAAAAANALGPRMRTFFEAIKAYIPTGATVKVQRTYQVLNSVNGLITAEANMSTDPTSTVGTAVGGYSGAGGAVVNWETGLFNDKGHRVRGRSYLVPLSGIYDTEGSIGSTPLAALQTAANAALGGTGSIGVFSKPTTKGGSDGVFRTASAAIVHDKACVLRSRRD